MKLSILVPVFNEEKTIISVLNRLAKLKIPEITTEIIVVDDASTDGTGEKIKNSYFAKATRDKQKSRIKNLRVVRHKTNQGKGGAIRTGLKEAKGDYLIIQDADLEYDPLYIGKLMEPIIAGEAEVVYGTRLRRWPNLKREERSGRFLLHYMGNRVLSLLTSILYGQWITDMETGYKVFPRAALDRFVINAKGFEFEPEITAKLLKAGYTIHEIPIATIPRNYQEGKKLNTFRDGTRALVTLCKYWVME